MNTTLFYWNIDHMVCRSKFSKKIIFNIFSRKERSTFFELHGQQKCSLKNFANSRPSASNFKSFSRSPEHFLTVGQNNFGNKIPNTKPNFCQHDIHYVHKIKLFPMIMLILVNIEEMQLLIQYSLFSSKKGVWK